MRNKAVWVTDSPEQPRVEAEALGRRPGTEADRAGRGSPPIQGGTWLLASPAGIWLLPLLDYKLTWTWLVGTVAPTRCRPPPRPTSPPTRTPRRPWRVLLPPTRPRWQGNKNVEWSGHSQAQLGVVLVSGDPCHYLVATKGIPLVPGANGCSSLPSWLLLFASSQEMASSPSALALSSSTGVGLPVPLALRQRPVPVPRVAALPGGQLRPGIASASCSWVRPLRLELAAVSRPGARGRPPLFRTRAWMTTSQIASCAFTWGTIAVLPFYTLMVVAPNADLTKRTVQSTAPYVALGLLYAYLLYLSWTPDTLRAMFASKYWLPELAGIVRMFTSEMTVASAWIHLLVVDLFAARQVYHDGIKNNIETRHSVSLCLLFCPIGIATHVVTKVLAGVVGRSH